MLIVSLIIREKKTKTLSADMSSLPRSESQGQNRQLENKLYKEGGSWYLPPSYGSNSLLGSRMVPELETALHEGKDKLEISLRESHLPENTFRHCKSEQSESPTPCTIPFQKPQDTGRVVSWCNYCSMNCKRNLQRPRNTAWNLQHFYGLLFPFKAMSSQALGPGITLLL